MEKISSREYVLISHITNNNPITVYGHFNAFLTREENDGGITHVYTANVTVDLPKEGLGTSKTTEISTEFTEYDDLPVGKYETEYDKSDLYTIDTSYTESQTIKTNKVINNSKTYLRIYSIIIVIILSFCVWWLFWGLICRAIVKSKGYTGINGYSKNFGFVWGLLGIIGVIVCAVKPAVGEFATKTVVVQQPAATNTPKESKSISDQIKEINKLKEEGFITEEEYEAKKKQILGI